jgi:Fe-S cluster assembly scaffold protein SufB
MPTKDSVFFGPAAAFENQQLIQQKQGTLLPSDKIADEHCYLLYVPQGICADEIQTYAIGAAHSRLLIVLEEGASTQVQVWLGRGEGDPDSVHTTEIFLADEAKLSLLFVQESDAPTLTIRQRSSVGANAKLHIQNVSLGTGKLDHNFLSDVHGAHGESSIDWLFYSKNKEQQHINARNMFHAEDGGGEIVMKGVAEDEAHTICTGMIDIGLGGGGTDTYLTEDVLMLDKTAKVDAVPGLEIKTNDVKASHSATVSKVTKDDLFYFAARGIPENTAREMYVIGFLGDLTQRIANEQERTKVLEAIERKYQH